MKKLLYFPCHNTMEANELEIFSSLGYSCVTLGNFIRGNLIRHSNTQFDWTLHDWRKPNYNKDEELSTEFLKANPNFSGYSYNRFVLTKEYVCKFDVIVVSNSFWHLRHAIEGGHPYPGQKLVWCSVGQTNSELEKKVLECQKICNNTNRDNIFIVRCAPTESMLKNFCGINNHYIVGNVDPIFFDTEWIGDKHQVINVSRAIKRRSHNTNFQILKNIMNGLPHKIYGRGNEDLGAVSWNGGELSFQNLNKCYQHNRVFLSGGSAPAPLTYTFQEAMAVGIPIVALGPKLSRSIFGYANLYNMDKYIENGINGFVSDDVNKLKSYCKMLLEDYDLAKKISENARAYARKEWSFEAIKEKWEKMLSPKPKSNLSNLAQMTEILSGINNCKEPKHYDNFA